MTTEQKIFKDSFAPTLITFTKWVLKEADSRGVKRLYFLARDAYMSYLTAMKLVDVCNLDIECRYLEGSRIAWRMAEYHMLSDEKILDKICIGGVHVTLRKILSRGGLLSEEIEDCANRLGLCEELDKKLNYAEAVSYKQTLINEKQLFKYIRTHSIEKYDLAYNYFKQEGLLDLERISIVDSGWVGTMQQTLSNITGREVEGFYFGLYELPQNADNKNYHTFFFAPYKDIGKKIFFNNCLFEAIFSAAEGMTYGYEISEGNVIPVRETNNNPNKKRITANVNILKNLLEEEEFIDRVINTDPDKIVQEMQRLMSQPTKDEAECIGGYLFSDDVNQNSIQELAVPMTIEEIHNTHVLRRFMIMNGYYTKILKDSAWLEGSIVRCDKNVNYNLWQCRLYKWLIYVRKSLKQHADYQPL